MHCFFVFSWFFQRTGLQRTGNPSIFIVGHHQWISINEYQWISINEFIDGPSMNMVPFLWAPFFGPFFWPPWGRLWVPWGPGRHGAMGPGPGTQPPARMNSYEFVAQLGGALKVCFDVPLRDKWDPANARLGGPGPLGPKGGPKENTKEGAQRKGTIFIDGPSMNSLMVHQ